MPDDPNKPPDPPGTGELPPSTDPPPAPPTAESIADQVIQRLPPPAAAPAQPTQPPVAVVARPTQEEVYTEFQRLTMDGRAGEALRYASEHHFAPALEEQKRLMAQTLEIQGQSAYTAYTTRLGKKWTPARDALFRETMTKHNVGWQNLVQASNLDAMMTLTLHADPTWNEEENKARMDAAKAEWEETQKKNSPVLTAGSNPITVPPVFGDNQAQKDSWEEEFGDLVDPEYINTNLAAFNVPHARLLFEAKKNEDPRFSEFSGSKRLRRRLWTALGTEDQLIPKPPAPRT